MAKAGGAKAGVLGALKAGGLRAALGLATGKAQRENQKMLSAMVTRLAAIVPFLGDALAGAKNKNAIANLMSIASTLEAIARTHQTTRTRLQREAKERLELKAPAPTMTQEAKPDAPEAAPQAAATPAPQPRRAAPKPVLAPTLDFKPPSVE